MTTVILLVLGLFVAVVFLVEAKTYHKLYTEAGRENYLALQYKSTSEQMLLLSVLGVMLVLYAAFLLLI